jgi:hypothetical protein
MNFIDLIGCLISAIFQRDKAIKRLSFFATEYVKSTIAHGPFMHQNKQRHQLQNSLFALVGAC